MADNTKTNFFLIKQNLKNMTMQRISILNVILHSQFRGKNQLKAKHAKMIIHLFWNVYTFDINDNFPEFCTLEFLQVVKK